MRLAIAILGGDAVLARQAALAYGLAGLLRSLPFPQCPPQALFAARSSGAVALTPEIFFDLRR